LFFNNPIQDINPIAHLGLRLQVPNCKGILFHLTDNESFLELICLLYYLGMLSFFLKLSTFLSVTRSRWGTSKTQIVVLISNYKTN
jgi:hypothetical protein